MNNHGYGVDWISIQLVLMMYMLNEYGVDVLTNDVDWIIVYKSALELEVHHDHLISVSFWGGGMGRCADPVVLHTGYKGSTFSQ